MPAVHQLTAGHTGYDAISNEARVLQRDLTARGVASRIFSDPAHVPPQLHHEIGTLDECATTVAPEDWVLLHLSVGSPANEVFRSLPCRKAILYHNVTPPAYYQAVNPELAERLTEGRSQVKALAGVADVVLADSAYNASELHGMGYGDVRVFPLALDFEPLRGPADPDLLARFDDDDITVLFVGRCAPNKAVDDVLRAFGAFQEFHAPHSRFLHVGSAAGARPYASLCEGLVRELGIRQVHFLGALPPASLNAAYRAADLFLCLSRHEGFCIPLLEAMAFDVPVVACDAGAMAETLDGAGVLLRDRDPVVVAEVLARLVHDHALRAAVVGGQRERLRRFEQRDAGRELLALLLGSS